MSATRHLSPAQFTKRFAPGDWGVTWDDVDDAVHAHHGEDMAELHESVSQHGVEEPVQVYRGQVIDGHHRVIAAKHAGKPIPWERALARG